MPPGPLTEKTKKEREKMKQEMIAIIKKDLQSIISNRRMFFVLLVVPIVLTVFMPTVFILTIRFAPEENREFAKILEMLPVAEQTLAGNLAFLGLLLNYVLPVFFLIIPIMAATVMAASSFVGEREKRTLETLLYCPLSLKQIFRSKVLASFLLSMFVSFSSFLVMLTVLETEIYFLERTFLFPDAKWLLIMLLVSPAVSLIAIILIVRTSARAQSMEDAQQGAVFLLLPVLLLVAGQFTGILLVNGWILFGLGVLCALLAALLFKRAIGNFRYELLLK